MLIICSVCVPEELSELPCLDNISDSFNFRVVVSLAFDLNLF